jgi:large subunit ribosomal protein L19
MNFYTSLSNKNQYINYIEKKFYPNCIIRNIKVGDFIKIEYYIFEENKKKIQFSEGLIINAKNIGAKKTFTLKQNILNIDLEQIFCLYSPNIISIIRKYSYKLKRSKLFFIKNIKNKSINLKKI